MTSLSLAANTIGFQRVTNWIEKLLASWEHHKKVTNTIKELSKLSDKELNDIGINRGDIYWIANEIPEGETR